MFESMASPGFLLAPSESPLSEAYIYDHCATQPRNIVAINLLYLNHFSLPWMLFEVGGAVFIMNSNIHLGKISLKAYFKASCRTVISVLILGSITSRCFGNGPELLPRGPRKRRKSGLSSFTLGFNGGRTFSLQCRRILSGRKLLVYHGGFVLL